MVPPVACYDHVTSFKSIPICSWHSSSRERLLSSTSGRLEYPDHPIRAIDQVLATNREGGWHLDLLCVRRLLELLTKMVILCLEIVVLVKKAQARFITRLGCSVREGCVSRRRGGVVERELLEFLLRWLRVLHLGCSKGSVLSSSLSGLSRRN